MAAKTCADLGVYGSLKHCAGQTVASGMRNRVYFIKKSDIVKFPVMGTLAGESPEDAAKYTGDFTLAETKKWQYIDLVIDKGTVESTPEGEAPNALFVNKLNVQHPTRDAYATAFARRALNDDLVYLFVERDGKARMIGNEAFNVVTKPSQKLGAKPTDESGTYLEITCYDVCPAPFYPGKIETEDGDISGENSGPAAA